MNGAVFVYNTGLPDVAASIRLTALIPAAYLGCRVLYFGANMDPETFLDKHQPRLLIFTKAFDDSLGVLARAAARRNVIMVVSLCDLHFSGDAGRRNRELSELSNALVVQTRPMAAEVQRQFGKSPEIIEEAIEYPRLAPKFSPGRPLKMLWYGHSANYDTLIPALLSLAAGRLGPMAMSIVSNQIPNFDGTGFIQKLTDMTFRFLPWSKATQFSETFECDIVFIPSIDSPAKRVKGHNRLVESINCGRVAVVHPLPQYQELSAYCFCGADYAASIRAAVANPADALKRVESGQHYIDNRFSQEVVAGKWQQLFERLGVRASRI